MPARPISDGIKGEKATFPGQKLAPSAAGVAFNPIRKIPLCIKISANYRAQHRGPPPAMARLLPLRAGVPNHIRGRYPPAAVARATIHLHVRAPHPPAGLATVMSSGGTEV